MNSRNRLQDVALIIMLGSFWLMFANRAFWMPMVFGGVLYVLSLYFPRTEPQDLKMADIFSIKNLETKRKFSVVALYVSIAAFGTYAYFHREQDGWYGLYCGFVIVLVFFIQESNRRYSESG